MFPYRFVVALLALAAACVATAVMAEDAVRVYTNAQNFPTLVLPICARAIKANVIVDGHFYNPSQL